MSEPNDSCVECRHSTTGRCADHAAQGAFFLAPNDVNVVYLPPPPCPACAAKDAEIGRLREALDKDKTGLTHALTKIRHEIRCRTWLLEGRGPYEWNDDRYKDEAGLMMRACDKIADDALIASGKLAHAALAPPPVAPEKPTFKPIKVLRDMQNPDKLPRSVSERLDEKT